MIIGIVALSVSSDLSILIVVVTVVRIVIVSVSLVRIGFTSLPPMNGVGFGVSLSALPALLVSLEHVNMIIWVLFIVNDRGCLRLQFALLQLAWGIPKEVLVGML